MLLDNAMYIVALAWLYVILMMSITERSVIAGIMTFLLYGVFPLVIILYLMGTPQRKRRRKEAEKLRMEEMRNEGLMQGEEARERKL